MSLSACAVRGAAGYVPPPAGPTYIVQDTFTRSDGSVLGSADTGQAWTAHTGTWGIATNKAKLVTQSGDSVATLDAGVTNFDLSCDITIQGAPGVVFRTIDASNFLLCMFNGGQIQIWQRVTGSYSQLSAVNFALGAGSLHTFRVTGVGNVLTSFVDGTQIQQITTSQFNTQTRYGLRQNDTAAARYDNFLLV